MVDVFVASIPPANLAGVELIQKERLITCRTTLHTWRGHTRLHIRGTPDFEKMRMAVRTALVTSAPYAVEFQPATELLMPGLDILDEHGSRYMAAPSSDGSQYDILSFSPCGDVPVGHPLGGTV